MTKETTGEFQAPESATIDPDGWEVRHRHNPFADPKIKMTRGVRQLLNLIDAAGPNGLLMVGDANLGRVLAWHLQRSQEIPMGKESRWRTIGRTARTLSERGFIEINCTKTDDTLGRGEKAGTAWWLTLKPLGRKVLVSTPAETIPNPGRQAWTFTTGTLHGAAIRAHELRPEGYGLAETTYDGLTSWPDEQVTMQMNRAPSDREQTIVMRLGTAIDGAGPLSDYYDRWLGGKKPTRDRAQKEVAYLAAFVVESRMTPDPKKVQDVSAALMFLSEADLLATRRWLFDLGGPELQATMTDRMMTDPGGLKPWQWVSGTLDEMWATCWKGNAHGPDRRWALRQIRRLAVAAVQASLDLDHDLVVYAATGSEMAEKTREREARET